MVEYTIIDKFIEVARNYKNNVCLIVNKKEEYTYLDLDEISNGLAKRICNIFSDVQIPILVFGDHPLHIACSIIGVMKSRNIVVPVSDKTPTNRIQEIINVCNIKGYISSIEHKELNLTRIPIEYERENHIIYRGDVDDCAYIIYTSGTTGKSKGVLVQHKGLMNSVKERNTVLGINSNSHSINLMGFSFDGFFMSFFSPLIAGAKLFLPNSISDYKEICSIIRDFPVSTFLCTPTFLKSLLVYSEDGLLDNISLISLVGEQVNVALIERFSEKYPFIQIANEYGPTENSICTSINPDVRNQTVISAGKIIKNVEAKIVCGSRVCRQGQIGELFLSGVGLAKGYVNDDFLTNEKFVRHDDKIWYHTGDLAYWNNDELFIWGRIDKQIKVNGYRLDLGEIENAILKHNDVNDCVVVYNKEEGLTAYINSMHKIQREEMIDFLRNYKDEYMLPVNYIQVPSIPMLESGKINYSALYELGKNCSVKENYCEKLDMPVQQICEIYKEIFQLNECNSNENFFACGGNSILAVVLCVRIKEKFNVDIKIEDIRVNPTPYLLSKSIFNLSYDVFSVDIHPFNRFWFIDCYYTSLLALLEYYSVPIAPFIRSFIIQNIEIKGNYHFLYDYKVPLSEVFSNLGMIYDSGILENDFEDKIFNYLIKQRVVMLHVDCFYIPYCKEKYQKEHFEHVVTIVGYDRKKKEFNIIDQKKLDSVSFVFHKARIDDIRDAAYSAIVNRATFDNVDFVSVYPKKNRNFQKIQELSDSQFNFVVKKTIEYVRKNPQDIIHVLQVFLNYLKVEEEVFKFAKDVIKSRFLQRKESQIMRFLMNIITDKNNSDANAEKLIQIMERWEEL